MTRKGFRGPQQHGDPPFGASVEIADGARYTILLRHCLAHSNILEILCGYLTMLFVSLFDS
jgi:hypothetical protein